MKTMNRFVSQCKSIKSDSKTVLSTLSIKYNAAYSYILCILLTILLGGCESFNQIKLPDNLHKSYQETSMAVDECEKLLQSFTQNNNKEDYIALAKTIPELKFDYKGYELDVEQKRFCLNHKYVVDSVRDAVYKVIADNKDLQTILIANHEEQLVDKSLTEPFYAKRGDILNLNIKSNKTFNFKVYNADSKEVIYTANSTSRVNKSITIEYSAIYLYEVTVPATQYIDMVISRKVQDINELTKKTDIQIENVECNKSDFRAKSSDGIEIKNIFEEPRRITLRSQSKSSFSGSSRSVIAVQIPAGSTDILYRLRISTSEHDKNQDGEFFNQMDERYREIRFLGLPVYESTKKNTSILRELLNTTEPPREEEAYCSMFIFTTEAEARKFQNQTSLNEVKYNIDYSVTGTQSINGNIPTKGLKTIYFGFENQKMTGNVYLWFEAASTINKTEYFKEQYKLVEHL